MTPTALTLEWSYLYVERLGILCGKDEPTEEQRRIAAKEADEQIERMKGME